LGDLPASEEVTKLALRKCKLNLEEALTQLTDPDVIAVLEQEVKQE
jgi:hypothetical protein